MNNRIAPKKPNDASMRFPRRDRKRMALNRINQEDFDAVITSTLRVEGELQKD